MMGSVVIVVVAILKAMLHHGTPHAIVVMVRHKPRAQQHTHCQRGHKYGASP